METSCVRCWGLEKVGVDKTTKHSNCKCSAPLNLDWKNCMGNSNAQPGRSLNDLAIFATVWTRKIRWYPASWYLPSKPHTMLHGLRAYVSYGQWSVWDVLGPTCSQIHRVDQLMIFLHCNASISRAFVAIKWVVCELMWDVSNIWNGMASAEWSVLSDGTCGTHSILQSPFQTTLMFLFSEITLEQGQEYCPWCVGEHQPVRHCVVGVLSTRCHKLWCVRHFVV